MATDRSPRCARTHRARGRRRGLAQRQPRRPRSWRASRSRRFYDLDAPLARVCSEEVPMPYAEAPGGGGAAAGRRRSSPRVQAAWSRRCAMIEFRLPSLGADMDEGKLLEWQVQPGDAVKTRRRGGAWSTPPRRRSTSRCWQDGIDATSCSSSRATTVPVGTVLALLRGAGRSAAAPARRRPRRRRAPAPPRHARRRAAAARRGAAPPPRAGRAAASRPRRAGAPASSGIDADAHRRHRRRRRGDARRRRARRAAQPRRRGRRAAPQPTARAEMRKAIAAAMSALQARDPALLPRRGRCRCGARTRLARARRTRARPVTERLLLAALLLKAVALRAARRTRSSTASAATARFRAGDGVHVGVAISLRSGGLVAPAHPRRRPARRSTS
ncbi:MAG: hypothetical protein MZW92_76835 [Comamonadaceae bacterium]|nr:hypothetical protein [Comamonadaceae bacterium]